MVSSVSSPNSDYIQQLLAQMMMQNTSTQATDGSVKISQDDLSSVNSTDTKGKPNFLKIISENFDKIDTNQDGLLSKDELQSFKPSPPPMGPPPGMSIENFVSTGNTDGTDGLSKDELSSIGSGDDKKASHLAKKLAQNFDSLDTNKDGQVTLDEIMAAKPNQETSQTTAMASANTDSSSDSLLSNFEDKLGKLSDFFVKQLLNAYEKNAASFTSSATSSLTSNLKSSLTSALDIAV